jgi:uncharacterized membrane protein HdeD (DUF308 family)
MLVLNAIPGIMYLITGCSITLAWYDAENKSRNILISGVINILFGFVYLSAIAPTFFNGH